MFVFKKLHCESLVKGILDSINKYISFGTGVEKREELLLSLKSCQASLVGWGRVVEGGRMVGVGRGRDRQ